jgi:hypothetical protein
MSAFVFPDLAGIAEEYERDGFVIVRKLLDADLLRELNQHVDWLIERHPELQPEGLGCHLIVDDPGHQGGLAMSVSVSWPCGRRHQ